MPLSLTYADHSGKTHTLHLSEHERSEFFIGRRDPSFTPDINLTWDHDVSHRHARLFFDLGAWCIEAVADANPTLVNGAALVPGVPYELPADAEIALGKAGKTILRTQHNQTDPIPDGLVTPHRAEIGRAAPPGAEDKRIEVLSRLATLGDGTTALPLAALVNMLRGTFLAAHSGGIALYQDKEIYVPACFPQGAAQISFTLARRALAARGAFRWDRAAASEASQQQSSLTGIVQALHAPILRGARALGVLFLHTSSAFADSDLDLLIAIAETLSSSPRFQADSFEDRLPSIFLSYSNKDTVFVRRLAADLRRQRVRIWFDERLHGGEVWQAQLVQAIRQADALALVMSPDSLSSPYVQWELEQAQNAGKRIFPLWHQLCDSVPPALDRIQRINLIDRYAEGVLELVEELNTLLEVGQAAPTPLPIQGKIRILFLAANPRDTDALRLGEEVRTIEERLRHGDRRARYDSPIQKWAVRTSDLIDYLQDHKPHIVHFSGHGSLAGEIILEDAAGNARPVDPAALARLFGALREDDPENCPRCVVLNACFSAQQAQSIAEEVGCVVGMSRAVGDDAAIAFAGRFYDSLVRDKSVRQAFNLARAEMGFFSEHETPQLIASGIDPTKLRF